MDFEQPGGLSENSLPSTHKHSCHREPVEQTLEGKKDSFRRLQVKRELVVRQRKENQAGQTDAVGFPPPIRDRPQSREGDGH